MRSFSLRAKAPDSLIERAECSPDRISVRFKGMTLVDVLVGTALALVIFMGLFGIIRASLTVSSLAKLKSTATAIATTRMEYIRSLEYSAVGTVGGIPAGVVPQYATTTNDGTDFVTRVFIEYMDDPADGEGGLDENDIITDYKRVKVSTSYIGNSTLKNVTLVSNFAPPGIETTTGGGTLRIQVVDSLGAPVSGASVRIANALLSPAVDVTTFSSVSGIVYLPGAEASTGYEVEVSKDGYSSAQTYERVAPNENPSPGFLTVIGNVTTASTFAIDVLSTLTVRTFSPMQSFLYIEPFDDETGLASSANVSAAGGVLSLSGAPGTYAASGSAVLTDAAPEYLVAWANASSSVDAPAGTNVLFFVEDGAGSQVPDTDLPGNSSGFTEVQDLSLLSTTTYPALSLRIELSSSDPNVTPTVNSSRIGYSAGPIPLPDVSFTLQGAKTIGSTAGGASLYKTEVATTTDASGVRTLKLEWDSYEITLPDNVLISSDPVSPYDLLPGAATSSVLILLP